MTRNPLILALDVPNSIEATKICNLLQDRIKLFKVGLQLFLSEGKKIVEVIKALGGEIFLDLKLHDIPSQVERACERIVEMEVEIFTIHTIGGLEMMKAAVSSVEKHSATRRKRKPKILGVTVLTSFDNQSFKKLGFEKKLSDQIISLTKKAREAGLDGVVAPPQETAIIRKIVGEDFLVVTPGIRFPGTPIYDQKNKLTPREALDLGASYIVVGRPILQSSDLVKATEKFLEEIKNFF